MNAGDDIYDLNEEASSSTGGTSHPVSPDDEDDEIALLSDILNGEDDESIQRPTLGWQTLGWQVCGDTTAEDNNAEQHDQTPIYLATVSPFVEKTEEETTSHDRSILATNDVNPMLQVESEHSETHGKHLEEDINKISDPMFETVPVDEAKADTKGNAVRTQESYREIHSLTGTGLSGDNAEHSNIFSSDQTLQPHVSVAATNYQTVGPVGNTGQARLVDNVKDEKNTQDAWNASDQYQEHASQQIPVIQIPQKEVPKIQAKLTTDSTMQPKKAPPAKVLPPDQAKTSCPPVDPAREPTLERPVEHVSPKDTASTNRRPAVCQSSRSGYEEQQQESNGVVCGQLQEGSTGQPIQTPLIPPEQTPNHTATLNGESRPEMKPRQTQTSISKVNQANEAKTDKPVEKDMSEKDILTTRRPEVHPAPHEELKAKESDNDNKNWSQQQETPIKDLEPTKQSPTPTSQPVRKAFLCLPPQTTQTSCPPVDQEAKMDRSCDNNISATCEASTCMRSVVHETSRSYPNSQVDHHGQKQLQLTIPSGVAKEMSKPSSLKNETESISLPVDQAEGAKLDTAEMSKSSSKKNKTESSSLPVDQAEEEKPDTAEISKPSSLKSKTECSSLPVDQAEEAKLVTAEISMPLNLKIETESSSLPVDQAKEAELETAEMSKPLNLKTKTERSSLPVDQAEEARLDAAEMSKPLNLKTNTESSSLPVDQVEETELDTAAFQWDDEYGQKHLEKQDPSQSSRLVQMFAVRQEIHPSRYQERETNLDGSAEIIVPPIEGQQQQGTQSPSLDHGAIPAIVDTKCEEYKTKSIPNSPQSPNVMFRYRPVDQANGEDDVIEQDNGTEFFKYRVIKLPSWPVRKKILSTLARPFSKRTPGEQSRCSDCSSASSTDVGSAGDSEHRHTENLAPRTEFQGLMNVPAHVTDAQKSASESYYLPTYRQESILKHKSDKKWKDMAFELLYFRSPLRTVLYAITLFGIAFLCLILGLVLRGSRSDSSATKDTGNCFDTTAELRNAVDRWAGRDPFDSRDIQETYGASMNHWCVSKISDFSSLFSANRNPRLRSFDADISAWDLSAATNCTNMFRGATAFNRDVSRWNTAKVRDMSFMFYGATAFDQDISGWSTSNVETMRSMFNQASSFSRGLNSWKTYKVRDMRFMFYKASSFRRGVSSWDLSSVANTSFMFFNSSLFHDDVSHWNVGRVEDMQFMFHGAVQFNSDVSGWNVGSVENMRSMFNGAKFSRDISKWQVSRVRDISFMFDEVSQFNSDISNWDISGVETMKQTFYNCAAFNQDLSRWNVGSVRDMSFLFYGASLFNQDISQWNTSSVETMKAMFHYASSFQQDLSQWNTTKVRDMSYMFYAASKFDADISNWDVSRVTTLVEMFARAKEFDQDLSPWRVSRVQNFSRAFFGATTFDQDLSAWDVSGANSVAYMFVGATDYRHNLCAWGRKLPVDADVRGMFSSTTCAYIDIEPDLTASPPGPFCHECS